MLVVVAIIGVLVALLLPAVQSARESSRATACRNNVRQFALALLVHADAKKQFPRGLVCTTGTCDLTGSFDGRYSARSTDWGESFTIRILPFLEYQSIYDAYQFDQPNSLLANNKAVVPWLSTLLCPGRDRGVLYMKDANPNRQYVSRVQYGGNFGAGYAISETLSWQQGLRGIFNGAKQWGAAIKDVTDGLSKTLLVGETTIDPDANSDSRGAWNQQGSTGFTGGLGVAAPTTADIAAGMRAPNNTRLDIIGGANMADNAIYCPNTRGTANPAYYCVDGSRGMAVRSTHPGGVNVACADGNVQFITDGIDLVTWYRLHTIQGGETIGDY